MIVVSEYGNLFGYRKKKLDLGSSLFIYFGRGVGLAIIYHSVICMCFLYKFMVGYICSKLHTVNLIRMFCWNKVHWMKKFEFNFLDYLFTGIMC